MSKEWTVLKEGGVLLITITLYDYHSNKEIAQFMANVVPHIGERFSLVTEGEDTVTIGRRRHHHWRVVDVRYGARLHFTNGEINPMSSGITAVELWVERVGFDGDIVGGATKCCPLCRSKVTDENE